MTNYLDSTDRINKVIDYITSQIGKPYSSNESPPKTWSAGRLMARSWEKGGIDIPSNLKSQFRSLVKLNDVTSGNSGSLQKGDLLYYFQNNIESVSMYVGNNNVIEVSKTSGVQQVPVWNSWNTTNFTYAGRPNKIGVYGGSGNQGNEDTPRGGENNNNFQPTIVTTKEIKANAVAVSDIFGTPQTARFAVINLTMESIYLKQTNSEVNFESDFWLEGKPIILGNEKEIELDIIGGNNSSNIDIVSSWIQSKNQAEAIGYLISEYLQYQFKTIVVEIFGNPLIQLGDMVNFDYSIGNFNSDSNVLYVVCGINHSYSTGLSTTLTLKPIMETISTV